MRKLNLALFCLFTSAFLFAREKEAVPVQPVKSRIAVKPVKPVEYTKVTGFDPVQPWKFGIALYSFHNVSLPGQLERAKSAGVSYVEGFEFGSAGPELKDSLIMQLSPAGLEKVRKIVAESGLKMESMYAVGGNTVAAWERDFKMAGILKLRFITAEPPTNMWKSIDSLAGVYKIKVAIHNHWRGMSKYWSPDSVLAALKGHPNFGVCADIGHWPKSGINPVQGLKKLRGHILAVHFKDVAAYNNPKLDDVVAGTGVVDFKGVLAELKRQHFSGNIYIERDFIEKPDNLPSVLKIVSYYNSLL